MTIKAEYVAEPNAIQIVPLPEGGCDIWLRKNITEVTKTEQMAEQTETVTVYEADEAYMRACEQVDSISDDEFEDWWAKAVEWSPTAQKTLTDAERIAQLEAANAELQEQLSVTMSAVDSLILDGLSSEEV